jgi:hypothetical protein
MKSAGIVLAGDVRTLLCEGLQRELRQTVVEVLQARYYVHIFAIIRPSVLYKASQCQPSEASSPFLNRSLSHVQHASVTAAVAALGTNFTLRIHSERETLPKNATCFLSHGNVDAHWSQWHTVGRTFAMLKHHERITGSRFDILMRLRPDSKPVVFGQAPESRLFTDFPEGDSGYCSSKDGQAIMRRKFGDAYFSAAKAYAECRYQEAFAASLGAWSIRVGPGWRCVCGGQPPPRAVAQGFATRPSCSGRPNSSCCSRVQRTNCHGNIDGWHARHAQEAGARPITSEACAQSFRFRLERPHSCEPPQLCEVS